MLFGKQVNKQFGRGWACFGQRGLVLKIGPPLYELVVSLWFPLKPTQTRVPS